MSIVSSIGKLIKTCTPKILNGQNKVIRSGCEKLVNPELIQASKLISYSKLNLPESQVKDVLSLYQKYLQQSKSMSHIDFNPLSISEHAEEFFASNELRSFDLAQFEKNNSLDVLKSFIRNNVNDISPEAKALLNDLKYYGLDPKSAEIVQRFEQNGIELITSSQYRELNKKLAEFLEFSQKNNLTMPKEINLFAKGMENDTAARYIFSSRNIEMNPVNLSTKNQVFKLMNGIRKTAQDDYEVFLHEYFHYLHDSSIAQEQFRKLSDKTLFGYLCEKDLPEFKSAIYDYDDLWSAICPEFNESGNIKALATTVDKLKKRAPDIFGEEAPKAIEVINRAFEKCKLVASSSRDYATHTPLETVAECGKDIAIGKKLPKEVLELLEELGCPKLEL